VLESMGKKLQIDGDTIDLNGLRFLLSLKDFKQVTSDDQIVLLKPPDWVKYYEDLLGSEKIDNVLELGVFQGGMAFLLPSMNAELRYLGVEMKPEHAGVSSILAKRPDIGDRVRIEFSRSQDDPTLPALVKEYFGGQPLDLVIDDASHMYGYTRRSFSQFFPLLRPGGLYIIEDWGWAHWPGYEPPKHWTVGPCLSNVLFEIAMATATEKDMIDKVEVYPAMFVVRRGQGPLPEGWTLDQSINIKGQAYSPVLSGRFNWVRLVRYNWWPRLLRRLRRL